MLHRAILGSVERFIGILIEEHAGALPAWLAPVQAVILTITDDQHEYARQLEKTLAKLGWRVESDLRNEKIGFKIREHTLQRIPYLLVVGKKEAQEGTLAVRTRKGEDLGGMTPDAFHAKLTRETASRGVTILEEQKHRDG
jgi:threonyl-tRNA synthetase